MKAPVNVYVAVVDDDESLCRSMGRLLRAQGIHAVTYLSAEDFLGDAKRPEFDCLVLDIRLGGMSGIELNRQLVSSGSTTPVIFLTANDDAKMRDEAERTPHAAYLKKTDSAEVVLEVIRKAIHQDLSQANGAGTGEGQKTGKTTSEEVR